MTTLTEAARGPSPLRRMLAGIDWVATVLIISTTIAMVAIVVVQVFMRYALNSSLDWADEVSRLLFVWSVFLAIPLGIKRGAHVGVELLTAWLPPSIQLGLFRLVSLLAIVLMAVVGWQAWILTYDQWDEPLTTLDISVGMFLVPLVIGSAHSILHLLAALVDGPPAKTVISE
jgi:TRAP-type transport system small permease protein